MHILTNGPHLVTPQQALEVSQTHILGEICCYFWMVIVKDPEGGEKLKNLGPLYWLALNML